MSIVFCQLPPAAIKSSKKISKAEIATSRMAATIARIYDEINETHHPILSREDEVIVYQGEKVGERDVVVLSCIAEEMLGCKVRVVKGAERVRPSQS